MRNASSAQARYYLIGAILLSLLAFVIAFTFVEPPPPSSLRMAAGSKGGAYYAFAEHYRELLARERIDLEVLETAGSLQNLKLLSEEEGGVDFTLLQGGVLEEQPEGLIALASVFLEPLWVFHRILPGERPRDLVEADLALMKGERIAVGAPGSGTRHLALKLLAANGVDGGNSTLLDLGGRDASAALLAGEADAAIFVANIRSDIVQGLLRSPGVELVSFERAEAYHQRDHAMSRVVLYEGAVDLARSIPPRDIELIAPTASIIAREDLHPAIISLLLQALEEVHGEGDLFQERGRFPELERTILPSDPEAERFFKSGPPFLQRILPFWIANLVDRLVVLIIPLLTLVIPLARILPPVYRWRIRRRIHKLYAALAHLEARFGLGELEPEEAIGELDKLEARAEEIELPASYVSEIYELRFHLERVREVIRAAAPSS